MNKPTAFVFVTLAVFAAACSRSDVRHAQSQAQEARQQVKQDLETANQKLKDGFRRANEETKRDLDTARAQLRDALHKTQRDLNNH